MLFGDDAEMDGFIYALYGAVLEGRVAPRELRGIMEAVGAYSDDIDSATVALEELPRSDVIELIFVHLARRSLPTRLVELGERVVPVYSYAQAAVVLVDRGLLSAAAGLAVLREVDDGMRLPTDCQDIVRRGYGSRAAVARMLDELPDDDALVGPLEEALWLIDSLEERGPRRPPSTPPVVDWLALARRWRRGR